MLVLSRSVNQKIVIEGGITICVVSIENGHVKLGIDAPKDIRVDRSEVHHARMTNPRIEENHD